MKKVRLFSHILTVTNFIFLIIFSISISSANTLDFKLFSPTTVLTNSSFPVSIFIDSQEKFDIKIFLLDNQNNTISDILIGSNWKSSFYYIKDAWPSMKEYSLKSNKLVEEGKLCLRVRKGGASKFIETCNPILFSSKVDSQNIKKEETALPSQVPSLENYSRLENNSLDLIKEEVQSLSQLESKEKIYLQDNLSSAILTSQAKTRLAIICAFSILSMTLIVLILFNKI